MYFAVDIDASVLPSVVLTIFMNS